MKRISAGLALVALVVAAAWYGLGRSDRAAGPDAAGAARQVEAPAANEGTARGAAGAVQATSAGDRSDARSGAAAEDTTEDSTRTFHGRVTDESRFPLAAVELELVFPDGVLLAARSGADGAFELAGPPRTGRAGALRARDGSGRCAARKVELPPADDPDPARRLDLGTIVLRPCGALDVQVLRDGLHVAGAVVVAEMVQHGLVLAQLECDARGMVRCTDLPAGWLRLRAHTPDAAGSRSVVVPDSELGVIAIELAALRSVDVWVTDAETGEPIAGAEVRVIETYMVPAVSGWEQVGDRALMGEYGIDSYAELDVPPTDARGRTVISGLPASGRFVAKPRAAGYEELYRGPGAGLTQRIRDGATELRFELTRSGRRTVRWPVVAGEVAPPADGTELAVRQGPGYAYTFDPIPVPTTARMERAELVMDDLLPAANGLIVQAPDGAIAEVRVPEAGLVGEEVSFRRPRSIEVLVRDARRRPRDGARVHVETQGNNPLAEPLTTGPDGRAVFGDLIGGLVDVEVARPDFPSRILAGSVDLERGDGRVEVTLPRTFEALVRITQAGLPRLPESYRLHCSTGCVVRAEDPERAEVRVTLSESMDGAPVFLSLSATGYGSASREVAPPPGSTPAAVAFDLRPACTLVARVLRASAERIELVPQRWNAGEGGWNVFFHLEARELSMANGPGGTFRFAGLPPGRFRVLEKQSGLSSEGVEFPFEGGSAEVTLDLRSVIRVSGKVEAPEGTDLRLARVLARGEGIDAGDSGWLPGSTPPEGAYAFGGTFTLVIPSDRPVFVRAWHPFLEPDGEVEVRASRDDVVLRLKAGAEVRIPLHAIAAELDLRSVRVYAYEGEPAGPATRVLHAPVVEGVARFCGLEAGNWTLWVDPGREYAPAILRDVAVSGWSTVLSEPAFERGSTLRIRLQVGEGASAPRIFVSAFRGAQPRVLRQIDSDGEPLVLLSGLPAGRYQTQLFRGIGAGPAEPDELVVDGVHDVEWTLDLR